jgi:1-deoxy-D-xylulose-5-phosphate reductoisomerase
MDIALLGATGSIGLQTLDVIRTCLPEARVRVLTGNRNIEKLAALVDEFKPDMVWVPDGTAAGGLTDLISVSCEVLTGPKGLTACAAESPASVVVNALVGRAGLAPTLAAIRAGKNIALANKETLVTAGALVMEAARESGIRLTPIDSEHSAILQCLQGNDGNTVFKVYLTASGGPFREWPKERITKATADDALKHPNWDMGRKITIDSATLMNKGLEVIEAMWLFGTPLEDIQVLIHPQSVIHSMVRFTDGAVMAQMGTPDMRVPILYALTGPKRVKNDFPALDFLKQPSLTFSEPDTERFPCLRLALHAAKTGGTLPAVLNTVNELAVGAFLENKITFYGIPALIEGAFGSYTVRQAQTIQDIWDAEDWAEEYFNRSEASFLQRFPLV